jgi:hypothetical protein
MATNENVNIQINSKADLKGFKEAETAATKLNKTIRNLATTIGVAYGTRAVVNFGKASVKAFTEDEASVIRLTNAVDNLGYAFASTQITDFIKNLESTAGVADDVLRPAFQALLTTTKDLNTSYKLLNDAISISRGSGIDLATVSQDLANGYVGITRGLKKYNTGLTQAELKSRSFADILEVLNKQFSGANAAYIDSYAYKMDVLTVATNNAKETIGKGLVDAFARLAGGTEASDAAKAIDNIAQAINGLVTAVSYVVGGLVKLYKALDFITSFGGLTGANGKLGGGADAKKAAKTIIDTSKIQITASKTLAKATINNTKELKKQAALKKAGTVFDLEQIQLVAALKGKLSEDEKRRAEAQLALLNGNDEVATKLTQQILASQDATGNLAKLLTSLPDAKNPFQYLEGYLDSLKGKVNSLYPTGAPIDGNNMIPLGNTQTLPQTNAPSGGGIPNAGSLDYGGHVIGSEVPNFTPQQITLQVDGKTLAAVLMDQSLSGNQTYINRRTGGFDF